MAKIHDSIFHKVDKIASGSSYKTLKLWEFHDNIFTTVFKIGEIFVSSIKKSGCGKLQATTLPPTLSVLQVK